MSFRANSPNDNANTNGKMVNWQRTLEPTFWERSLRLVRHQTPSVSKKTFRLTLVNRKSELSTPKRFESMSVSLKAWENSLAVTTNRMRWSARGNHYLDKSKANTSSKSNCTTAKIIRMTNTVYFHPKTPYSKRSTIPSQLPEKN